MPSSLALLAQKKLLGQGCVSRWGQPVSLPASLGKVRLKMRWSHRCSQAGCWLACLGCLPPPVLLERRGKEHVYKLTKGGLEGPSQGMSPGVQESSWWPWETLAWSLTF